MAFIKKIIYTSLLSALLSVCGENKAGAQTQVTKWKFDRKGAVSITYDDGNINQFKNAMPVMDGLGLPGTFFIVTGEIPGSKYPPKFIGRPVEEIIKETAAIPTNKENFFERASAVGYLGYKGTLDFHLPAGVLYEREKIQEAYKVVDSAYANVRAGKFIKSKDTSWEASQSSANTWSDFKKYAAKGHEFGSHTISHPRLAILDEPNLLYELEKSKEDIYNNMGADHIFSAECPFGTENERVMEYAHKVFPALRNRMPETFMEELNRGNKTPPGSFKKEYVQWQRGALTNVSMPVLKSWVDTVSAHDNLWLVLVFHGVDGIGWEPRTTLDLESYFRYIKEQEDQVWIATFGDVTKYIRERMNTKLSTSKKGDNIIINLTHSLNKKIYGAELTLKTLVPSTWKKAIVKQNGKTKNVNVTKYGSGNFIIYEATPNAGAIEISKG